MTKHARPRNVPHPSPDPDGVAIEKRSRPEASQRRHWPEDPEGVKTGKKQRRPTPGRFDEKASGHQRGANVSNGLHRKRRPGTNGSWPASSEEPKQPAFCALYEDLAAGEGPQKVFGQYPKWFLAKILPWLRCERREILHVCSGSLPPGEGIRVDVRPEAKPDILADGRHLPLPDGWAAAVLIDPPYTRQYAKDLYGVKYPRPSHLLAEAARVVRPCGRIGFVHYLVPMPPSGCHHVKTFGLSTGFGFQMRALTIFERDQEGLPL